MPDAAVAFWSLRHPSISPEAWLFSPVNPQRLPPAARKLVELVAALSQKTGYTFAFPSFFIEQVAAESKSTWTKKTGYSGGYVRQLFRRLIDLGVLERRAARGGGQYRLAEAFRRMTDLWETAQETARRWAASVPLPGRTAARRKAQNATRGQSLPLQPPSPRLPLSSLTPDLQKAYFTGWEAFWKLKSETSDPQDDLWAAHDAAARALAEEVRQRLGVNDPLTPYTFIVNDLVAADSPERPDRPPGHPPPRSA